MFSEEPALNELEKQAEQSNQTLKIAAAQPGRVARDLSQNKFRDFAGCDARCECGSW